MVGEGIGHQGQGRDDRAVGVGAEPGVARGVAPAGGEPMTPDGDLLPTTVDAGHDVMVGLPGSQGAIDGQGPLRSQLGHRVALIGGGHEKTNPS